MLSYFLVDFLLNFIYFPSKIFSDKKNSGATTPSYPTTPGTNPSNQNASGQPNFPIPSSPASGGVQTPNSGNNSEQYIAFLTLDEKS